MHDRPRKGEEGPGAARSHVGTGGADACSAGHQAAPCRKGATSDADSSNRELPCAQAGLHRDVGEVRCGDGLLVAICRKRHTQSTAMIAIMIGRLIAMDVWADAHRTRGCIARSSRTRSDGGKALL